MRTKLLAAIAGLVSFATPALAYDVRTSCVYSRSFSNCRQVFVADAPAKPTPLTAEEIAARDERIAKWDAFCQPKKTVDEYGMTRLVYAHQGCANGRDE